MEQLDNDGVKIEQEERQTQSLIDTCTSELKGCTNALRNLENRVKETEKQIQYNEELIYHKVLFWNFSVSLFSSKENNFDTKSSGYVCKEKRWSLMISEEFTKNLCKSFIIAALKLHPG